MPEQTLLFNNKRIEYSEVINRGNTSEVFLLNDKTVIKSFKKSTKKAQNFFKREIFWLQELEKSSITPKIIDIDYDNCAVQMEYCGKAISKENLPPDWQHQLNDILKTLKSINCRHNDLFTDELMVLEGKIFIIDFGMASLGEDFTCGGVCEPYSKVRIFSDDYIHNQILLKFTDQFSNSEPHCFVLWDAEENQEIERQISNSFQITQKITYSLSSIKLLGPTRLDFLFKFYHGRVTKHGNKAKQPFIVYAVMDNSPNYDVRSNVYNGDVNIVNTNMFDLLQEIRSGRSGLIHGSDCIQESYDNLESLDIYGSSIPLNNWTAWRPKFETIYDFFETLNKTKGLNYLVLRNYESLLKNELPNKDSDIDLLVNDFHQLKRVAGAIGYKHKTKHSYKNSADAYEYGGYKVGATVLIGGKEIFIDIRFIGDNYYCERWEKDMLKERKKNTELYVPEDLQYFYSLLYHALVHKLSISEKYRKVLTDEAVKLKVIEKNISQITDEMAWQLLDQYMEKMGYRYVRPNELSIPFNARSKTDITIEDDVSLYKKMLKNRQHREARHVLFQLLRVEPYNLTFRWHLIKIKLRFKVNKVLGKDSKLFMMNLKGES